MTKQALTWVKSSYSGGEGGNCVETTSHDGAVFVRDTKDHGNGHVHKFTADAWRTFVDGIKAV